MATLGSLLVQHQIVGVTQIEQALQRQVIQGGDLATNLLELGLVDEDVLAAYAAQALDMPTLMRELLEVPNQRALTAVPWELVDKFRFLPIRLESDNCLLVATPNRLESDELDDSAWRLGLRIEALFAHKVRVAMGLNVHFGIPIPPRMFTLARRLEPGFEANVAPTIVPPSQSRAGGIFSLAPAAPEVPDAVRSAPLVSVGPRVEVAGERVAVRAKDATIRFVAQSKKSTARAIPVANAGAEPRPTPAAAVQSGLGEGLESVPLVEALPAPAPVDFDEARKRLAHAKSRDDILDVVVAFSRSVFEFCVLFVVHGRVAEGRAAVWGDRLKSDLEHLSVPLDQGGMFQTAFETRSFYLGPPGGSSADDDSLRALGRSSLANCAILPVTLRHRVILLIYGDRADRGVEPERVAAMVRLNQLVAEAFERLLLERKYGAYRKPESLAPESPPELQPAAVSVAPPPVENGRSKDWAGRYHVSASSADEATTGGLVDNVAAPTRSLPQVPRAPLRPSRPPIGRIQTIRPFLDVSSDQRMEPVVEVNPHQAPPISASSSYVPSSPVLRPGQGNGGGMAPPPTIIIEMHEEIDRLVQRVLTARRFDDAAAELLVGIGDDAILALLPSFPGPLGYNRFQAEGMLPRVAAHGPLLRTLLMFGKAAVPHLIPFLESVDPNQRFYATFMFSELPYPSALGALVARVFDNDQQIRALAIDVLRGFSQFPEYHWALRDVVAVLVSDQATPAAKRIASVTLGELREPTAVPALIECLSSDDGVLCERSHRSLVKITFEDRGFAPERWETWFVSNRHRHRLEWAIDALGGRGESQRKAALAELRRYTGSAVDWPQGPIEERYWQEIRRQCRDWWKNEGKAFYAYRHDG